MRAPASTPAGLLAAPQPASSWAWMPISARSPKRVATTSVAAATWFGRLAPLVSQRVTFSAPASIAASREERGEPGALAVRVEEVLGVVDDPLAALAAEGDRLGDHRQVLLARDLGHLLQVEAPGLADQGDHRREGARQGQERRVL